MFKKIILLFILFFNLESQQSSTQTEGLRNNPNGVYALKNLTIIPEPNKKIENGTIIFKDGIIQSIGEKILIPNDAIEIDCKGLTAYAGFIDLYTNFGQPKTKNLETSEHSSDAQQKSASQKGALSWNSNVNPQINSIDNFSFDEDAAEKFRSNGFTSVVSAPSKGIFKGSSILVLLKDGSTNNLVLKNDLMQNISFENSFGDGYPNSLTGAIALIRQTFYDANWYGNAKKNFEKNSNQLRIEENNALEKLNSDVVEKKYFVFETTDELNSLRAKKIINEFNLNAILRGNGFEYRRLSSIKKLNLPIILPLNFPNAPNVETVESAYDVEYSDLQHWDHAPENPARLIKEGINFSLSTSTMKDVSKFLPNLRLAVKRGLSETEALKSLTTFPANLINAEKQIGTLEVGKIANIILTNGNIFEDKTKIIDVWISGKKHEVTKQQQIDLRGKWNFSFSNKIDSGKIDISGEKENLVVKILFGKKEIKVSNSKFENKKLIFSFLGDSISEKGLIRISSMYENEKLFGNGEFPNGKKFIFNASKISDLESSIDTSKTEKPKMASFEVLYPENPFGMKEVPNQPEFLLLKNGTIWTSSSNGILQSTDILISKGKIIQIGKNLSPPKNCETIDCAGKQITAGLIDAHSHTAISNGVNESGQAITAEVRMGDVINSDDVNIYRELAGGLTTINVLHGSANSIGGQNQILKLRWGALPDEMKFDGAMPGIKFALGENPKQSNWGDRFTSRYPQTRMGVEQQIRDEFRAAQDYELEMKNYNSSQNLIPPRKNLELDAISEILNKKRVVHAHSYRQDEILMLARVAKDFNFKIATFQHVLEGYKIAEVIKEIGAGASCFSDWWAYKYEVVDAIPYAGALMHKAGVLVSFNSDSNEHARRMNLEAAKAIKYGGVSEEEALNFVTINPAKQLMIDNKVGSIEIGKDADIVIWSGSPLSTSSKCLQTWIDGRKYFDIEANKKTEEEVISKRATLIQKILSSSNKSGGGASKQQSRSSKYSCTEDFLGGN